MQAGVNHGATSVDKHADTHAPYNTGPALTVERFPIKKIKKRGKATLFNFKAIAGKNIEYLFS